MYGTYPRVGGLAAEHRRPANPVLRGENQAALKLPLGCLNAVRKTARAQQLVSCLNQLAPSHAPQLLLRKIAHCILLGLRLNARFSPCSIKGI